ncbi:unnamed protein product [Arabidopsis lyrata]|nr:unnamed protein product [Arabidopsis lyrata]
MSQLDLWWLRRRVLQGFAVSPEFKGFLWLVWPDVGGSGSWRERVSGCWWRFCLLGSFGDVFFFAECYLSFGCGFWWAGFVFEAQQWFRLLVLLLRGRDRFMSVGGIDWFALSACKGWCSSLAYPQPFSKVPLCA